MVVVLSFSVRPSLNGHARFGIQKESVPLPRGEGEKSGLVTSTHYACMENKERSCYRRRRNVTRAERGAGGGAHFVLCIMCQIYDGAQVQRTVVVLNIRWLRVTYVRMDSWKRTCIMANSASICQSVCRARAT